MTSLEHWEAALRCLKIPYRAIQLPKRSILFCQLSEGTLFNVEIRQDGTARMWRFLRDDMPKQQVGRRLIYEVPEAPGTELGFEVIEDGVLNCYLELDDAPAGQDAGQWVERWLRWFIRKLPQLQEGCQKRNDGQS